MSEPEKANVRFSAIPDGEPFRWIVILEVTNDDDEPLQNPRSIPDVPGMTAADAIQWVINRLKEEAPGLVVGEAPK